MDKHGESTVKNELTYGRGYVYSLQYHLVWCTKYRKKVLRDGIDTECREMLEEMAGDITLLSDARLSIQTISGNF